MNITYRQLQIFNAVAEHMSFTHAADKLFLTQPAVSMQIKQLETAVGLPLYEQLGKKIYLTDAGKLISDFSLDILKKFDETEDQINNLKGIEGGLLQITVATTVNYFAARILSIFCQQHPNIRVNLDVTNRSTIFSKLENNETDIVLMGDVPNNLDCVVEPWMDNPLVIIAPPNHSLVDQSDIPLSKIKNDPLLMREVGSGTREAMEKFFLEKKNFKLVSKIEMNSNEAIKQSVEAGLGLGFVSLHTIELEVEVGKLKVLDIHDLPIMGQWHVVHRKGKRLNAAASLFKEFVLENKPHAILKRSE